MTHRASAEQLDRYRRKGAAAEFLRAHRVPEQLETVLDQVFLQKPADLHGFLAEYFLKLSAPPRISSLRGTQVYDAAGQLSVQAQVFCVICNKEKRMSSAAVPSCWPHQETSVERKMADHVTTAVQWINGPLNHLLQGQNPFDQSEVDQKLRDFFKARYEEEKNLQDMKTRENCSPKELYMELPSPPPTQRKSKTSADRGKQKNLSEKAVPPAEPEEAVLCGSAAIGSLSVAVLKTGAAVKNIPLYRHTAALKNAVLRQTTPGLKPPAHNQNQNQNHVPVQVPVCLVTLLRGGKTSPGRRSLLKEVILIPGVGRRVRQILTMTLELQKEVMRIMNTSTKGGANQTIVCDAGALVVSFDRPEQLLDVITEACANLGLALGTQIHLALNCAAPELMDYSKGKYEVSTGVLKSPDELVDMYHTLLSRYPVVVSLIDPFRREDSDQWEKLNNKMGKSCSLISDLTYKLEAPPPPGARGFILKHTNHTTVSDLIHIASEQQGSVLIGTTCSEPCTDDSWSDIAVGLGLDYVKLGGLSGAETISKYNRLVSIEEELVEQGILVTKERLPPPLFPEDLDEQLVPVEPNICEGEQNPVCSS